MQKSWIKMWQRGDKRVNLREGEQKFVIIKREREQMNQHCYGWIMQRGSLQTHMQRTGGVFQAEPASRDAERERDPGSARTSVAYGNGSCSKEAQLLVKMLILLDAAFESSRRAIRNNTSDNFSQPLGCTRQDTHLRLSAYSHLRFVD